MDHKLPDEEIMVGVKEGSSEAVEVIFMRYKSKVLSFCFRILNNRADAEDVTSDVFMTLVKAKYTYDPKAKFSTWLFTVAHNSCISRIRKRKNITSLWYRSKEGRIEQFDAEDSKEHSRETLEKKEAVRRVRSAIHKLPLEQKEAIILREYLKLNYEEISHVMHCSLDKVKILIFRAREQLRGELTSFIKEEES